MNAVGIDCAKGKSMITVRRPFGSSHDKEHKKPNSHKTPIKWTVYGLYFSFKNNHRPKSYILKENI